MFENHKKVSFYIASRASNIYILSGQKVDKNVNFGDFLWKPVAFGQTVLPDKSGYIRKRLVENTKIEKLKCDNLSDFQTLWQTDLWWKWK